MTSKTISQLLRPLLLTIAAFAAVSPAMAQDDILLTQSWAVPTFYNPAATGDVDFLRIRGGTRLQWLGISNAPKAFFGMADMPFKIGKKRLGTGVTVSQESLGLFSNLLINAQLSYKFKLLKGTFSVGIQPGYYNSKFRGTDVYIPDGDDYHQPTDPGIPTQDLTGNAFDLSAGVSYTHRYFSVGISGVHLLGPKINLNTETASGETSGETAQYQTELRPTLYFTADSNIPIKNSLFELQPSLLVASDFNSWKAHIDLRARYNKFLSFGVGYRYNDAVSVMVAAEFKNFFLGYAYDYPTSAIAKASSGSHELVAGYQIKLDFSNKNKNRHRSIRIM